MAWYVFLQPFAVAVAATIVDSAIAPAVDGGLTAGDIPAAAAAGS